jgi:hypothetical protein
MSARRILTSGFAVGAACGAATLFILVPAAMAQEACAELPPAQQAVANPWQQPSTQAVAGRTSADAPLLGVGRRTRVSLLPTRDIPLLRTSRPRPQESAHHAGLLRLRVTTSGRYVVASAAKTWLEVIPDDATEPLVTEDVDRALRCAGIHKALSYRLEAGHGYVLQISEAAEAQVDVLVVSLPAGQVPTKKWR